MRCRAANQPTSSASSLPLVRLEPVNLPCPLEDTWAPFLSRFDGLHRTTAKVAALPEAEMARAAQQSLV